MTPAARSFAIERATGQKPDMSAIQARWGIGSFIRNTAGALVPGAGTVLGALGIGDGQPGNVFTNNTPMGAGSAGPGLQTLTGAPPLYGNAPGVSVQAAADALASLGLGVPAPPQNPSNLPSAPGQFSAGMLGSPFAKPMQDSRLKAPKGYVIVSLEQGQPYYAEVLASGMGYPATVNGKPAVKLAMLKELARKYKLWTPRRKPLMTGGDLNTIRKAERLQRKVAKAAKSAGVSCRLPTKRRR